jgi:hypothetical protein
MTIHCELAEEVDDGDSLRVESMSSGSKSGVAAFKLAEVVDDGDSLRVESAICIEVGGGGLQAGRGGR